MKKKVMALGCAAAVLIASVSIGGAWSYFTTYAETSGERTISLGDVTEIHEDISDWTKKVRVTSEPKSQPVYVRVQAFAGSAYQDLLQYSGADWVKPAGDDYYYYTQPVIATEEEEGETSQLEISLKNIPDSLPPGDNDFNVVIVYETTPVIFGADGNPIGYDRVDWSQKVNTEAKGGE